ncbi:MAG: hypothetical protein L3J65_08275 [Robiginitomaculum sp.]|nr:hypothetical protein [Robiginitomaculum sp.]
MAAKCFKYSIKITDPKKAARNRKGGDVQVKPRFVNSKGKERALTANEKRHYKNDRAGFEDLDFNAPFDRKTKFIFNIDKKSKWEFQDPPLVIDGGKVEIKRLSKKRARLIINGHGSVDSKIKHYYKLMYQDNKGNNKWEHDPVIGTGTIPPPDP